MRSFSILLQSAALSAAAFALISALPFFSRAEESPTPCSQNMSIYDITIKASDGSEKALSDYKGKTLLIVNTATHCGFTPQYNELQKLYEELHAEGLEILDFPCNQFGAQAPGSDEEIHAFCTMRFNITFPQFAKVDVNGENAAPLFRYLTSHAPFQGFGSSPIAEKMEQIAEKKDPHFKNNGNIKWNFTKFIIDKEGNIAARFEPTQSIESVRAKVKELLSEGNK